MSRKSSGVGDLARLGTTSNQIEECEISATLLSDSFGAEEFSAQPSAQLINAIDELHSSERVLPFPRSTASELILHCPSCDAETFLGDRFCQECGNVQPAFEEGKGSLAPDIVKQLVAANSKGLWAIIALSVSVLLLLAGVFSILRVSDDLEKALAANRLNDAVALSERLMVSHFGSLSGRDAELYSSAFFKRAQVFAQNGNFKRALFDISKVLPNYSKSVEVAQLKIIYMNQSGKVAAGSGTSPEVGTAPARGITHDPHTFAVPGNSAVDERASSVRNSAVGAAYMPPGAGWQPALPGSRRLTSTLKNSAVISNSANNLSSKNLPAETQAASSSSTNSDAEEVDSEEADMAAYNRYLADYFSKKNNNSPAKDPPSFSEWVQSGKTEF